MKFPGKKIIHASQPTYLNKKSTPSGKKIVHAFRDCLISKLRDCRKFNVKAVANLAYFFASGVVDSNVEFPLGHLRFLNFEVETERKKIGKDDEENNDVDKNDEEALIKKKNPFSGTLGIFLREVILLTTKPRNCMDSQGNSSNSSSKRASKQLLLGADFVDQGNGDSGDDEESDDTAVHDITTIAAMYKSLNQYRDVAAGVEVVIEELVLPSLGKEKDAEHRQRVKKVLAGLGEEEESE